MRNQLTRWKSCFYFFTFALVRVSFERWNHRLYIKDGCRWSDVTCWLVRACLWRFSHRNSSCSSATLTGPSSCFILESFRPEPATETISEFTELRSAEQDAHFLRTRGGAPCWSLERAGWRTLAVQTSIDFIQSVAETLTCCFTSSTTRYSAETPAEPPGAWPRCKRCRSCTGCCCSIGTWRRRWPGTSGWGGSYRSPCTWCTDGWSSHLENQTHAQISDWLTEKILSGAEKEKCVLHF